MLPEDKKRQILDKVKEMERDGVPKDTIQRLVDNFKTKYDVPETQIAPVAPVQKTAQDFGRQPINVSGRETTATDWTKSIGRGLVGGALNTLGSISGGIAKGAEMIGADKSGVNLFRGAQDVLNTGAENLRQKNMQLATETRNPKLYGASNVGEFAGGELANPINYATVGTGGLLKKLGGGVVSGIAGQASYNPEIDQMDRVTKFGADVAAGTLLPYGMEGINKLVSKSSPLVKGRVQAEMNKLFPETKISDMSKAMKPKVEQQVENIAGRILGGKKDIKPETIKAITELPIEQIKTQEGFKNAINTRIKNLAEKMDDFVTKNYTQADDVNKYTKSFNLADGQSITENPISNAVQDLAKFYNETGDTSSLAKVINLQQKISTGGITKQEINTLAREYGSEFKKKAFGVTGEPLTSLSAGRYENTREALKGAFREGLPKEIVDYDKRMSGLYDARINVDKNIERVNSLKRVLKERGLLEKMSIGLFNFVDLLSFGSIKGISRGLVKSLVPDFAKNRLDALEVEGLLNKNLKKLVSEAKKAGIDPNLPELKAIADNIKVNSQQSKLELLQRGLNAEKDMAAGKIVGDNFTTEPTYSLTRNNRTPKAEFESPYIQPQTIKRESNVTLPDEPKRTSLIRNASIQRGAVEPPKTTDYKKLAREMKMPKEMTSNQKLLVDAKKFTLVEFLNTYKFVADEKRLTKIWKEANK